MVTHTRTYTYTGREEGGTSAYMSLRDMIAISCNRLTMYVPPQVLPDGTGVYVGGERGGLAYLSRAQGDGTLTLENTWMASHFDEALEVCV